MVRISSSGAGFCRHLGARVVVRAPQMDIYVASSSRACTHCDGEMNEGGGGGGG